MGQSLASKIEAANSALLTDGNLDAVGKFFTSDYFAHLTDQEITGGHAAIRSVVGMYQRAFSDLEVDVEIIVEGRTELPGKEPSRVPTRATSRASLPLVVRSCGATW
jgi:SnoaL-like polyketide cyclase